ncbi:MAG: hypothetical protein WD063_13720 [Pirellulales bacterium]
MQLLIRRILIDGSILTAIVAPVLVLTLYINPRIALSDYPKDVRAAVPPRTRKELRQGILIALFLIPVSIAIPFYSAYLVKQQTSGTIAYWMAFVTIFGEYVLVSLFDLIVLDILMFHTWTPRFVVIPGTEGMPGYKHWRPHAKAQLTKGNLIISVFSAILALVPTYFY